MSSFDIRAFRRADRDQLARLVNSHAAAVMPGASVSVNTVLSQLEREPDEFIVDPWVSERRTLVAEQSGAIVAAALMLRYRADTDVGETYRNAGEIRWLLFWPMAPADNRFWEDGHAAADVLMNACLAQFDTWHVTHRHADGALPHPGVYGVPAQWPHIEHLYERHDFDPGHTEIILMADLDRVDEPGEAPLAGLAVQRLLGVNGTRLTAHIDGEPVGSIEVRRRRAPPARCRYLVGASRRSMASPRPLRSAARLRLAGRDRDDRVPRPEWLHGDHSHAKRLDSSRHPSRTHPITAPEHIQSTRPATGGAGRYRCSVSPGRQGSAGAAGAGDERGHDVGGVAVKAVAGAVVTHRCAWVGVRRCFLDITQWDASVERGGDERDSWAFEVHRRVTSCDDANIELPARAHRVASDEIVWFLPELNPDADVVEWMAVRITERPSREVEAVDHHSHTSVSRRPAAVPTANGVHGFAHIQVNGPHRSWPLVRRRHLDA